MKKNILILFTLLLMVLSATAQEVTTDPQKKSKKNGDDEMKTLFGNQRSNGGYGAFWLGYSIIDDRHAMQFGGRGSWIIQHSFALGFGGTGFINEYHYDPALGREVFLTGGYGGLYIEPIIYPNSPVHMAFPILIGAGGVSFVAYDDPNWDNNYVEDYDTFMIIEPSAELEMNLTRFMRIGLGVTYRLPYSFNVGTSNTGYASAESIKGFSYNLSFKFGSF